MNNALWNTNCSMHKEFKNVKIMSKLTKILRLGLKNRVLNNCLFLPIKLCDLFVLLFRQTIKISQISHFFHNSLKLASLSFCNYFFEEDREQMFTKTKGDISQLHKSDNVITCQNRCCYVDDGTYLISASVQTYWYRRDVAMNWLCVPNDGVCWWCIVLQETNRPKTHVGPR